MRWFRFKSIRSHIAAAFALVILFTALVMSFLSYQLSQTAVQNTAKDYTAELIKQLNANIHTYITNMENISSIVLNDRKVSRYFDGEASAAMNAAQREELRAQISEFFHTILVSREDIASINVFGYDGDFVSDRKDATLNPYIDIAEQPWFQAAKAAQGDVVVSSSHVQPIFRDEYRWVVSLSRELRSPTSGEGLGVLLVDLNFRVMNDIFNKIDLGQRGYVFVVDNNGNIVYHPQQQLIYSGLKTEQIEEVNRRGSGSFLTSDGGPNRIYTVQDTGFGWNIVGVSYVDDLVDNRRQMQLSFVALTGLCLVIALLLSLLISRRLSRPILQLQEHMKEVERGRFDIQVPVEDSREIGRLAKTFNLMVAQIRNLMAQVVKEQEIKRKSELNALQAQINPHFLYNTLDSIVWMAEGKKSEEVVRMTSSLARLFRISISKGREMVPIRTEIEHITHYLTIQKMRYKDRLDFHIEADPDILDCQTLKVLLQPLVENAIYHGIKNKPGGGTIRITGKKDGNRILFHVQDNGVGMEENMVKRLLHKDGPGSRKGFGVRNVQERIRLYFGDDYGLSFASRPGEGTTVTVCIPAVPSADMQEGGEAK